MMYRYKCIFVLIASLSHSCRLFNSEGFHRIDDTVRGSSPETPQEGGIQLYSDVKP